MESPFGLKTARMTPAETNSEPVGAYDADEQLWIGGDAASAGYCTKFGPVCAFGVCVSYNRQLWDNGPVGC
jgi:hypothetical protein